MVLNLSIKEKYFFEIMAGTKTEEYRDISDYYKQKLLTYDKKGEITGTKEFEKVRFYTGQYMKGKARPYADFAITGINVKVDEATNSACFVISLGEMLGSSFPNTKIIKHGEGKKESTPRS